MSNYILPATSTVDSLSEIVKVYILFVQTNSGRHKFTFKFNDESRKVNSL